VVPEDARALPTWRAFVVQMHADADVVQGRIVGRAEHVRSGEATRFATLDELLGFMARILQAPRPASGGVPDQGGDIL
jgi:hypothetical protein